MFSHINFTLACSPIKCSSIIYIYIICTYNGQTHHLWEGCSRFLGEGSPAGPLVDGGMLPHNPLHTLHVTLPVYIGQLCHLLSRRQGLQGLWNTVTKYSLQCSIFSSYAVVGLTPFLSAVTNPVGSRSALVFNTINFSKSCRRKG